MKKIFAAIFALVLIVSGLKLMGDFDKIGGERQDLGRGYVRAECTERSAQQIIESFSATLLWTEQLDGIKVYYAFSDGINGYETVHGKRVNIMIAERVDLTIFGSPLIKGSF